MAEVAKFYNRLGLTPVSADPASPSQGEYQESDGTHREAGLWRYDGTDWVQIKGGSGINYLEDAANADSWTDDTNFTVTENTSSPLRAPRDLLLSKAAVDASTETVSIPFSIDDADLAKVLPLTLEYKSDSAYIDGDYEIEIYDVTNAAVIANSNPEILANELGNTHRTYFQTAVDSNSYELRIKVVTTSATASSMQIDSPFCGPERLAASQTIVSDWVEFTPTWTNDTGLGLTNTRSRYKRDGTDIILDVVQEATGNGTDNASLALTLPDGLTADVAVTGTITVAYPAGQMADASVYRTIKWFAFSTTQIAFVEQGLQSIFGNEIASGDKISIQARVPIVGWESGTKPNEVISGREVSVGGYTLSGATIPNATVTTIAYENIDFDTTGSYDTSTGIFTVPESGRYRVSAQLHWDNSANWSASEVGVIYLYKNGSVFSRDTNEPMVNAASSVYLNAKIHALVDCVKGDQLEIRCFQNSGAALGLENAERSWNNFSIEKINSLSSQITPTEDIIVAYTSDSGQVTNTGDTIIYEDKLKDTHNAYDTSTGVFTAPVSGVYEITATAFSNQSGWTVTQTKSIQFRVNETNPYYIVDHHEQQTSDNSGSTMIINLEGTVKIPLNAGDTLKIVVFHSPTTVTMGGTSSVYNKLFIQKVGN